MLRLPIVIGVAGLWCCGCGQLVDTKPRQTRDHVNRIADELDGKTKNTGVYERIQDPELPDRDAWGTPLRVTYSQGGVAEMVKVTSAGPDREHGNSDDISAERMAMNFKGVGEGIKQNAGSVARDVAKGAVEGVADGVSETVGDAASVVKDAVKKRLPIGKRDQPNKATENVPTEKEPSE